MIQYSLKCAAGHAFDSWFQSADAYEKLAGAGMVSCAICGSSEVTKSMMAPRVRPSRKAAAVPPGETGRGAGGAGHDQGHPGTRDRGGDRGGAPGQRPAGAPVRGDLRAPGTDLEKAMSELRRQVEEKADYVGMEFATEARAMHNGESPERPIYGEARLDEARKLLEDGVPVAPLPFRPTRKTN